MTLKIKFKMITQKFLKIQNKKFKDKTFLLFEMITFIFKLILFLNILILIFLEKLKKFS
jgi:hypothetical protein